jgi:D-3-phosphoglycerate dehydrogenase
VALLKGFLEQTSTSSVTYVNAPIFAVERGITVKEGKSRQSKDYVNLIIVSAVDEEGRVSAGATIVGKSQEMFVNVLDFEITIAPSDYMAIIRYEDKPGMIGKVGNILGSRDINIKGLQVGRKQVDGDAAMGLSLQSPIPSDLLKVIRSEPGIKEALFIIL